MIWLFPFSFFVQCNSDHCQLQSREFVYHSHTTNDLVQLIATQQPFNRRMASCDWTIPPFLCNVHHASRHTSGGKNSVINTTNYKNICLTEKLKHLFLSLKNVCGTYNVTSEKEPLIAFH